ncbi:GNAT family N-acetyltransferase [Roseomonas sp. CECT 9278]|uniref:GNAT family N-acetyltransferase n=1 Tax=Roseomonas sp. CECT 9278 TaxID=2845823 RepID=UPI001E5922A7|nr:GNAT family N-acetyltransferase [Roseomonas sp. CECT 9278]CAH0206202.1 hypothetical protein ROS9278_02051 [Roseomonas sp. CECT 9278]
MTAARILRLDALPPDVALLDAAARAEGFRMVGTLLAEGFAPFTAPGCALFAARDPVGSLLGIGGITRDPHGPGLRMRRFYVRPQARRGGLGRALAMAVLDHARASGASCIRLRAPASAAAFWEGCGFTPMRAAQATHGLRL